MYFVYLYLTITLSMFSVISGHLVVAYMLHKRRLKLADKYADEIIAKMKDLGANLQTSIDDDDDSDRTLN